MTTIYSEDGVTVAALYREAPQRHWVQDTTNPPTGHYEPADVAHGYFPLVEVERPSPDHVRTVERDGDTFTEVWTFDQARQDARLANEADQADRHQKATTVAQAIPWLRTEAARARSTTVTVGNHMGVTQAIVDNLAIFYDRFADFLEANHHDDPIG